MTETRKKKKSLRKVLLVLLFVAINVAVIVATAVNEFGDRQNASQLSEVTLNWWMLIPAVLCFVVGVFANVVKYVLMIKKSSPAEKKMDNKEIWKLAWRVVMLGRYYDNITPASIGGQPFQIYHMRKHSNLPAGETTSIPICGMITSQIGFLIIALVCFAYGGVFKDNPALLVAGWIGLAVYAFWPVMVAGTSLFPKGVSKILQFGVKILVKLHIVKNREATLNKVEHEVNEYSKSIKKILRVRGLFVKIIIWSVIYNFAIVAIPFFVLKAFGGDIDFFKCLAMTVAVTAAVYFVPTPGNAGAAEGTFYIVFSALSTGFIFWAMLVWRLISYYSYIIIGPLIYFRMHLEKKKSETKKYV